MKTLATATTVAWMMSVAVVCAAQEEDQRQRIQNRLDEVRTIKSDEMDTISLLESQLAKAIVSEDNEQISRIQKEIASINERVDRLTSLEKQLLALQTVVENKPPENREDRLRLSSRQPSIQKIGSDQVEDPQRRSPRESGSADEAADAEKISRLDHLIDSKRHLESVGEFELARQVDQLIRRERDRLAVAGDDSAHEGGVQVDRITPRSDPALRRFSGEDRAPRRNRDAADPDTRGDRELRRLGAGDNRPEGDDRRADDDFRLPGAKDDEADETVQQLRDLLREMQGEIKRLQDEVQSLKKDQQQRDR